jgi:hypothetical protein
MNDRKPVDYDELFPGRFLKAGLFQGKKVPLTITDVDIEELPQDNGKDRVRGILSFKQTPKQLVLNSTNGQCLKAMFGRKVSDWVGKRVVFCAETDKFGRETVEAVRIWGSPDLDADMSVDIQLPRRKPRPRVLHAAEKKGKAQDFSDADGDGR